MQEIFNTSKYQIYWHLILEFYWGGSGNGNGECNCNCNCGICCKLLQLSRHVAVVTIAAAAVVGVLSKICCCCRILVKCLALHMAGMSGMLFNTLLCQSNAPPNPAPFMQILWQGAGGRAQLNQSLSWPTNQLKTTHTRSGVWLKKISSKNRENVTKECDFFSRRVCVNYFKYLNRNLPESHLSQPLEQ